MVEFKKFPVKIRVIYRNDQEDKKQEIKKLFSLIDNLRKIKEK